MILLSSVAHAADAALSARKILALASMPHRADQHDLQITLSAGISIYPDDGTDADTLLKNADIAMLSAKDNGRNNYQFFRSTMNERALERQSIEGNLRHALERGEFVLHYQPKVDLVDRAAHRRRSTPPMGSAAARFSASQGFYSSRRAVRLHRAHRALGASRGLPAKAALERGQSCPGPGGSKYFCG